MRQNRSHPPRIGLTGSAGVGKTTLALTLAATLDVPVAEEPMRARLRAGFSLHSLSREEHRTLLAGDAAGLESLAEGEAHRGGFVADRTPLDYAAFWLCAGYAADDPVGTDALIQRAAAAVAGWDLVVVLPWGAFPVEDDGYRYPNPWHQLHVQTVMEGLCRRYVPAERLAFLPESLLDPEARCAWVLRRLSTASR